MNKKMIRTLALTASALALVCTAAFAQDDVWTKGSGITKVKAGEFKLLLSPELFKGSRADGYKTAWNGVAKVAAGLGWKAEIHEELTNLKEDMRLFTYPDTADGALQKQHYTLRHRVPVKADGTLNHGEGDLTLKYTAKDGEDIPAEAFMKGMPEGTKAKSEANVYGYVDKQAGKNLAHHTFQVTFKKEPTLNGSETLAYFAKKYPVMATLGIPADAAVSMPTSKYVMTYALNIGTLKRGPIQLDVEACSWFNKDTGEFVTAEVSWRSVSKEVANSYELFNAIQNQIPEILDAGKSKNALIK